MTRTGFPDAAPFVHDSSRPVIGLAPRWMLREGASPNEPLIETPNIDHLLCQALLSAGALPLMLPMTHDAQELTAYVELCDGFVVSGGPDVDPALFGGDPNYDKALLCPERDAMELPLIKLVLAANKPLVTICRGTQLLNVALGGTLNMDVYSRAPKPKTVLWNHTGVLTRPVHPVLIEPTSKLAAALGTTTVQTNSAHHCIVDRLGEGLKLVGWATDGVPEAIEYTESRFCVGVQWHPEQTWQSIPSDFALWKALVSACSSR